MASSFSTATDAPSQPSAPIAEMAPPSPSSSPNPAKRGTEMAPPPPTHKLKPTMSIPIPPHTTETLSSAPSTSSSTSTSTWPISTPTSRTHTPLTSGVSTPTTEQSPSHSRLRPIHLCRLPQRDKKGNLLDVLERTYLKPEEEVDIEEALQCPPLPGTFRYVVEREVRGGKKNAKEISSEDKKAEFERVKRELRGG
ncbi:uncharacterized protein LY89DRAFT_729784 [Mollisia scopiformis]|uniref:Uncharacterized protein n=1 Tax=Mollisia scopiformis TaxID=149040 RepID=A0A194XL63_MOLSC|nr:uncharacterized protein LY89DRAFT_729784 [Mollisia scopiformis]KUJ20975.1 hypothetical protein LY89DRAFT_729784 [Mollisia scopiformis]